ncbi:DUF2058 domain-containing protein [Cognatiluteimonas profundi]|uniref:DUF2058 domain-containing protein n=1 Tax=Cognatiluteimonas profundi TaxID=2594501 RepID=UPI00131B9FC3|nr:DUF2058 family protein [Lysobacter profundi]
MTDSLRDQLLGLGFKATPVAERKPAQAKPGNDRHAPARGPQGRPGNNKPAAGQPGRPMARPVRGRPADAAGRSRPPSPPRSREDIDLAKAYAIRAQREKDERIEAERLKQEQARQRREAKARAAELLKDKALNDPAADIARHFDYGGKIKRIHVNADQLKALNAGELGVVQMDGRYLLVDAALLQQVEAIFPPCVALKVDPSASAADDPYADPLYQVPDDLVW